jgi:hypothetical protein
MRFKSGVVFAVLCSVSFAMPASSHHSHSNYITEKFIDLQGVVKEVHFVLPHSWVYMDVKDASGEPQVWALEATGRVQLAGMGVTSEYIKPGDAIKARCHPLRDGSNGCLLGFLKAKDGTVKDWDGGNAPVPKDF